MATDVMRSGDAAWSVVCEYRQCCGLRGAWQRHCSCQNRNSSQTEKPAYLPVHVHDEATSWAKGENCAEGQFNGRDGAS
ncbi:hypothetical protein [Metallibacterium sp.]|uniref:hypothetical protein n=1 Tax=Metallibacterium sp. TaxID=2940281 RepID=UPI002638EE47|nr:hypothetical protein [Metallibacterium sp.]